MRSEPDLVYAGVDIGGTGLRAGLVAPQGERLGRLFDEPRDHDLLSQLGRIARVLRAEAVAAGLSIEAVGIAIPGSVDPLTKLVASAPTAPTMLGLDPTRIGFDDIPVRTIVNDANSALVGECLRGAAVGARHAVGVFIGTGVGGAAIVGNELLCGKSGHAGEIGHMVVEPDGHPCLCGGRGCLEQYASGTAVARWYSDRSGRPTDSAATVASEAAAGSSIARAAFIEMGRRLGAAVATLANLFNPEVVVIGGGVAAVPDLFLDELRCTARRHTMPLISRNLRIELGTLGRHAGVIGAAILAMRADDVA